MKHAFGLVLATLVACHGAAEPRTATIDRVSVVLVGSDEPLPFDPRGGRLTAVTQQVASVLGHPVVLELDTALGPQLRTSLEESVLASFENVARELVQLQREQRGAFEIATRIERIRCHYDAVVRYPEAKLEGKVLDVRSPPHRFPLLERGTLSSAVLDVATAELIARWGNVDPSQLSARDQQGWFDAMTTTRPGQGYLWIHVQRGRSATRQVSGLRAEHLERILRLAGVVTKSSPLERQVTDHLLTEGGWIRDGQSSDANPRVRELYTQWIGRSWPSFDDAQRMKLASGLYGGGRHAAGELPGFDELAFGLSIYDSWVGDGAPIPTPATRRGELQRLVLCPTLSRGDRETEIHLGCSPFFASVLSDPKKRGALAARIEAQHDQRLLEQTLLNIGSERVAEDRRRVGSVEEALAFLDALKDPGLFHHGFRVLFDDQRRRDDIQSALEAVAYPWWHDVPARRAMTLLALGRRRMALHPHYQDSQWELATKELGGPISADLFARFVAEGPIAVEMIPSMWKVLPKAAGRDPILARGVPLLLDRDAATREARSVTFLAQVRHRMCDEHDASGLSLVRSAVQAWASQHPAEAASVSNALADMTAARCAKTDTDSIR